jgi:hypothetical protein
MMAERRFSRLSMITSLAVLVSLLAAPIGTSVAWATSHDQPRLTNKQPMMRAPASPTAATSSPQALTPQRPMTLDSYADYVQDILQQEAMKVKTPGTADVKLTIGKDGRVRQTDVVRLEGPAALRDQITSMLSQLKLPALPADVNADVLVVDTTLAFDYPGIDLMDRFSRLPQR